MIQPTGYEPGDKPAGAWVDVRTDLRAFCVLALISLTAGLLLNQASRKPLPLVYRTPTERLRTALTRLDGNGPSVAASTLSAAPRDIGLDEFQAMVAAHTGVVLDARPSLIYREGHVPGAINLPRENFDADYHRLAEQLGRRKADPIAVYCSGADCEDSRLVADALAHLGHGRVLVYREGWDEWSQSGLPQEK